MNKATGKRGSLFTPKNIWLAFFFYVLIPSVLFQLCILPVFMPGLHDGTGLISGGDWSGYHRLAVELSDRIEVEGWSVWHLRPGEQAPAGLAAAVYTVTGIKKPWVLLPVNAAIHATAALVLLAIIFKVTGRLKTAFPAILPFALFITPFLWNSSLHKDGIFILGSMLTIYAFNLFALTTAPNQYLLTAKAALSLMVGLFLVWVVRPYGIEMLLYIGIFVALALSVYLLFNLKENKQVILNIVMLWAALIIMFPFTNTGIHHNYVDQTLFSSDQSSQTAPQQAEPQQDEAAAGDSHLQEPVTEAGEAWLRTPLLPEKADHILYTMSVMRDRYRINKPGAGSNIDEDVQFKQAFEVIFYIPRALQIGLLAPFPTHWFEDGRSDFNTIMRRVTGVEMLFTYAALIFTLIAFPIWFKKPHIYLTCAIPLGMILTYALVVINIGTLHRMRYGFLMTLVACGIAAAFELLEKRRLSSAKPDNEDLRHGS